jgi:glycosyltransferase involved in cell wall biosynthesis
MISFIIPVRNEEKAIEKTLHSLKALSLPHEIIVTDGGSSDNTIALAKTLTDKVVEHPKDKKQNAASNRNNGAKYASGDYFVFVDCDVVINDIDYFFNKLIKQFETDSQLVAMTVWVKVQPDLETTADNIILGAFNYLFVFMNNVLNIGAAVGKFQMIRKDAFVKLSGFNEALVSNEDHDMFRRLSKIGKTRMDSSLLAFYSGRRAHQLGWPKLLWIWTRDTFAVLFRNKAVSDDWTDVR